jgi:predicted phosphodiesterase
MIYLTGDTHGKVNRFSTKNFPEQKEMTKDDYVIILGDFGLVWDYKGESKEEKYWLDWLENKPFTTLFIDGNHENFDRLDNYPVEEWHGGKVHKIRPSVIHLMRGQVFTIEDNTFFTFGGASSHDISGGILNANSPDFEEARNILNKCHKSYRINHISWWERELPSRAEMNEGIENLKKHNNYVDFILTHCTYTSLLRQLDGFPPLYKSDYLDKYLQQIEETVEYKEWLFGHFHINKSFYYKEKTTCFYEQILRIV